MSPPQKGDFWVLRMWWACPKGGSPAGEQGDSVTPEDRGWLHVISPVWVRCCWGNTIILELESPHPYHLRRTRILGRGRAGPPKDNRSPVWKWWKESVMSVIVLTSWFPEAQPHGPAGTCSRRKRNMGGAHGLTIISLFSKSNTQENPSFVSNSFFARVTW